MRRFARAAWALAAAALLATAPAPAEKRIDERGGDPRAAWWRLGPEAKEAFVLGVVEGLRAALPLGVEEPSDWPGVAVLVSGVDSLYAEADHAYTPWSAAAEIELRRTLTRWPWDATPVTLDQLGAEARAAWLADHPKAARRARRGAGEESRLPRADPRAAEQDHCAVFQEWLLREFVAAEGAAEGAADAPLQEKLRAGAVELPQGRAVVVAGPVHTHRELRFEDLLVRFEPRADEAAACSATVVLVDGTPTRLDGIPASIRRRVKAGK